MFDWFRKLFRKELTDTQKSALLLDEKYPGWDKKVNLRTLQMWDADNCVLAQLYGNYSRGLSAIGLVSIHENYNFATDTKGWTQEVMKRR